jgi:hypothetical protein
MKLYRNGIICDINEKDTVTIERLKNAGYITETEYIEKMAVNSKKTNIKSKTLDK